VPAQHFEAPAHERELEQDQIAAQEGEARTGHASAGFHVHPAARELEVVAPGAPGFPHLAQHLVGVGCADVRRVGKRRERLLELRVDRRELFSERLRLPRDGLHGRDRVRRALPAALAAPIAFEASFCRARSDSTSGSSALRRPSSSSARSRRSSEPSRRRASASRTGAGSRRIAFKSSIAGPSGRRDGVLAARKPLRLVALAGERRRAASWPEYFSRNFATCSASLPTTMFCGIGPEEKPPLRIA
jgi:hypothetical protein